MDEVPDWDDGQLDPTLCELLEVLNRYGLRTISSCAGHLVTDENGVERSYPGHITIRMDGEQPEDMSVMCEGATVARVTITWNLPRGMWGEDRRRPS